MPSREDLGTARVDPPPPPVPGSPSPTQPDPAWTHKVALGRDGRQRHLSAVWDLPWKPRGCRPTSASPSPSPLRSKVVPTCPIGRS